MSARIMIVDDSFVMRSVLSQLVKPHDDLYIVGEASDGEEALKKARLLNPDVILLDLEMPKMNGSDFLVQIKKEIETSVLVISALNEMNSEKIEHLKSLGADDVIDKPSGSLSLNLGSRRGEKIIETIRTLLAKRKLSI
jgi:two-component system chemotaxis response regulator CheB